MITSGSYHIRPAGRHILTIGRDLIQDGYAAVVELVKNAYDADSPDVCISFKLNEQLDGYTIVISDKGHGMSRDVVLNQWMVPSTDDKLKRRTSPDGRIMQGRKGIGRYAASMLGDDLLLETVTKDGEKTTVYVDWEHFEEADFMDEVELLVDTVNCDEPQGTVLTISGDIALLEEWTQKQFENLRFELKKLISPVGTLVASENDFGIELHISGIPEVEDASETIEPYPIFELFDYKIEGVIAPDGTGELTYTLQKARNTVEEQIAFSRGRSTGCGQIEIDIRVYDRDKDAIESLIKRGLKDETGRYVGKLQARQLLNKYNGIGVYRNGFRIRPLGDADFDWLKLNEQRVQNPSQRIGSNQVIGYVQIQSEEMSGLIEKSARDGLKGNIAFANLKEITTAIIGKLEEKRFIYRQKEGLSRPILKVERELEKLFSYESLKRDIRAKLTKGGIDRKTTDEILGLLSRDAEDRNKVAEDIRKTVAVYQGQATLGKIINVILHEGRRPLNYFKNQIPNMRYFFDSFTKTKDIQKLERVVDIAEGVGMNADVFVKLFSRLDPLAAGKRSSKIDLPFNKAITDSLAVFEKEMKLHGVKTTVLGAEDSMLLCWPQDIYAIFTNLIDNSLFWMVEQDSSVKEISIEITTDTNGLVHIDYRDTGPGIEPSHIRNETIFEPQFSTKPEGTGLGLAIAGEAAVRNGLELTAIESDKGAYFRLQPIVEENDG